MNSRTLAMTVAAAFALTAANAADSEPGGEQDAPTLLTIMRDLDENTQQLSAALMVEDFDAMAAAARGIADHAKPTVRERVSILGALGSRAGNFRNFDALVHDAAVDIASAAEQRDIKAATASYNTMITNCVACHTEFRDDVRQLRRKAEQAAGE